MEEWASWYCFNKKADGTYEAELDEAWDEGSHYGGGTIGVEFLRPFGSKRPEVERFNEHQPDPNMPEQFDQEDGLFKFEKRMK